MIQKGKVFMNNHSQIVRLPIETQFPDTVKEVSVRIKGKTRVLSPVQNEWDDFFLSDELGRVL